MIDGIEESIEVYQNQEEKHIKSMETREKQTSTSLDPTAEISYAKMNLEQLQALLKKAAAKENYEEAAKLALEIKNIKN